MMSSAGTPGGHAERVAWPDVARAIAILFVVLNHATWFVAPEAMLSAAWAEAAAIFDTFRMPLFFFIAGLFAGRTLRLSFGELFRRRLAPLLWLYVLWSAISAGIDLLIDPSPQPLVGLAAILIWPSSYTWFIYALVLYSGAAWLLRRLPFWAQLLPAAALNVAVVSGFLGATPNPGIDKTAQYFVAFLAGVHLAPRVMRLASRARWTHATGLVLVFLTLAVVARQTHYGMFPGVGLILGATAIAAGVAVSAAIATTLPGRGLQALGKRTLPIYVLHMQPIQLLHLLVLSLPAGALPSVLIPPVAAAVAVAVSLAVHHATRNVAGLWGLPRFLARAIGSAPPPAEPAPVTPAEAAAGRSAARPRPAPGD